MQEEIEHKTINFAISTVKLSARTLLKGAQFFLRQYDKSASQGKQSMKRLIRQNRGVTNLEIEKTGIKDFDRYAKRYHIDYAIMEFFNSAVDVLKTLVVALGAGLGVWGAVNLMEGYGGDNPSAKSQGMKQLMAGGGVALIGITLIPLLSGLFG